MYDSCLQESAFWNRENWWSGTFFTSLETPQECCARPWEAEEVSAKSSYDAFPSTGFYHSRCTLKLHRQHWNLWHFGNGREVWTKQHLLSGWIAQMTLCQMNCCFPVLMQPPTHCPAISSPKCCPSCTSPRGHWTTGTTGSCDAVEEVW